MSLLLALTSGGATSAPVGLASETDLALALAGVQLRAAGLSAEADSAFALAGLQLRAAGLASETDAALALAGVQLRQAGLATETDSALALTGFQAYLPGIASETDTAFALAGVNLGQNVGAGRGSRLADFESRWAQLEPEIEEVAQESAKVRRRVRRKVARDLYLAPELPEVAQAYVDRLKAEREAAQLAEFRALLDMQIQASTAQADVARAAVAMAQKRRQDAQRAIEEFDVMYVAAILAEA